MYLLAFDILGTIEGYGGGGVFGATGIGIEDVLEQWLVSGAILCRDWGGTAYQERIQARET